MIDYIFIFGFPCLPVNLSSPVPVNIIGRVSFQFSRDVTPPFLDNLQFLICSTWQTARQMEQFDAKVYNLISVGSRMIYEVILSERNEARRRRD